MLLVLDAKKGRDAATSLVPRGEDAAALLRVVSPLDEARHARGEPRYVSKAATLDQRSVLVAPLIVQQRVLGYLYADIDGFRRFRDTDRDLLGMLTARRRRARQCAVCCELGQKWPSARPSSGNAPTSLRSSAAFNRASLPAQLQAIIDLSATSSAKSTIRRTRHESTAPVESVHFRTYENRERMTSNPSRFPQTDSALRLRTRGALVISENMAESAKYGGFTIPGTLPIKSALFVPLVAGDQARGLINLMDLNANTCTAPDVRLLETLAPA